MLVADVFRDSIRYEESTLAHCIHHLLMEGKVSLKDDASKLDFDQIDGGKVMEMIQANVLGIHEIGIYSLKAGKGKFVFIFAASEGEACQFYRETFGTLPLNCHEHPLCYQFARGKKFVSFREMRREYLQFPTLVRHG